MEEEDVIAGGGVVAMAVLSSDAVQLAQRRFPTWLWIVVGGLLALGAGVAVWLHHEPSDPVVAPPLVVPIIKRSAVHAAAPAAAVPDSPEAEPAAEEAPTLPVGTAELPEQLDRRQLEQGMEKANNAVEKCHQLENFVGTIIVRVTIAQKGNPQSTQLATPAARTPTTDCVVKAVQRNASFPPFRGTTIPSIELTYPFLFKEDGHLGPDPGRAPAVIVPTR
jgi:hypothetical protein